MHDRINGSGYRDSTVDRKHLTVDKTRLLTGQEPDDLRYLGRVTKSILWCVFEGKRFGSFRRILTEHPRIDESGSNGVGSESFIAELYG